jgi:hypothetical protein
MNMLLDVNNKGRDEKGLRTAKGDGTDVDAYRDWGHVVVAQEASLLVDTVTVFQVCVQATSLHG